MFSVFYKGFFSFFLVILLIANICFAFDLQLFNHNPLDYAWSFSYLGVSDILDFLSTRTLTGGFLDKFKNTMDAWYNQNANVFFPGIYTRLNLSNITDIFRLISYILTVIAWPISMICNAIGYFFYVVLCAVYIVLQLFVLFTGNYKSPLPEFSYQWDLVSGHVI